MANLIEVKKQELQNVAMQNEGLLSSLNEDDKKSFVDNFQELATNDYLMSTIRPQELLKFCIDITKAGLNINPMKKQLYIVPFNTEVKTQSGKQKVMLPQAIIPSKGWQQLAYVSGFFLKIEAVYSINGTIKAESELSREDQITLNTTSSKWVDDNLVGYDVIMEDLKGDIPTQKKFIEVSYCREVTKSLKDERFKVQSWKHKAIRRAMGDFFIPSHRSSDKMEKLENINDNVEVVDVSEVKSEKPLKKQSFADKDTKEPSSEDIIKEINSAYHDADDEKKAKIATIMSGNAGWREYSIDKLKELLTEVQGV